jgi:hypothetical protein
MRTKSVAVVGAGITGSVAALLLADQGYRVCLFDRAAVPISGASLINEGKIHLGFVYVNDPSMRSLDVMIQSAVVFRSILERWISKSCFEAAVTEPFDYIVPKDTQVAPDIIDLKFRLIAEKIGAAEKARQTRYLGMDRPAVWSRSSEVPANFDRENIIAHYQTLERSVDTHAIAAELINCLRSHDRIEMHMNTPITKISRESQTWTLQTKQEEKTKKFSPFINVINSSWDGRLELDEQVFGPDKVQWFHRYKSVLNLTPKAPHLIPNFTAIIGTYGDIISYPSGRVYLSYYPAGMLSSSDDIKAIKTRYNDETKARVATDTLEGLSQFVPNIQTILSVCEPNAANVTGGIIMARGSTDIDDSASELHQRYRIGIKERDGYFSIDTGKYTCGPAFAQQAVNRILA